MLLFNQINSIDNKFLNKEYFGKFFIRSLNVENENSFFLDNNSLQININDEEINESIFTLNSKVGYSFSVDAHDYKSTFNDSIAFKSYIFKKTSLYNNYTQIFLKSLKVISKNSNSLKFLFLTNPNKGGFICYSYGFLGFIPKNHCNFFLNKFLKKFRLFILKKKNLSFYLNVFKKEFYFFNIFTKYFVLNLNSFYTLNKFLIKSKFNKKNLLSKIDKKYKLNFVFLIKH